VADEDERLDAETAARYINLAVRSIYRLIHDGRLDVADVG
jgi:excisionase family DNA binding protein